MAQQDSTGPSQLSFLMKSSYLAIILGSSFSFSISNIFYKTIKLFYVIQTNRNSLNTSYNKIMKHSTTQRKFRVFSSSLLELIMMCDNLNSLLTQND